MAARRRAMMSAALGAAGSSGRACEVVIGISLRRASVDTSGRTEGNPARRRIVVVHLDEGSGAVALLVLLAAATGTGVVAADFAVDAGGSWRSGTIALAAISRFFGGPGLADIFRHSRWSRG